MKEIKTVGIVGFGVMGAAIGINAAIAGYNVIYKELNDDLVNSMYDKWVIKSLNKRVEKGKMNQNDMNAITEKIAGTSKYQELAQCDLIIEAAIEKMDLKKEIFKDLAKACPADTIFVSNTSTFPIENLMHGIPNQERTAGLHYFFPANINRLVEVIRQKETSDATYESLMEFAKRNRKIPITVKDFPGFAINPLFIASYMILDSFMGTTCNVSTLEDISQKALNVKFGIMWVQNAAGLGTSYHAAVSMNEYLQESDIGYPLVPESLKEQFNGNSPWNLKDGSVSVDEQLRSDVQNRLLGGIFSIATHLVEQDVVSVKDLELGICTSLAWPKGPFSMMNELGMEETAKLIQISNEAGDFKLPEKFKSASLTPWEI